MCTQLEEHFNAGLLSFFGEPLQQNDPFDESKPVERLEPYFMGSLPDFRGVSKPESLKKSRAQ